MRELYYNLNFDFNPLIDMNLPTALRHNRVVDSNINTELVTMLAEVRVKAANAAIFYSSPGFYTTICHVDCIIPCPEADWPSIAKLNFIAGDKNTNTMWYDLTIENRRKTIRASTSIAQPYQSYKLQDCINIETCNLSGWHLFEAGVPHTVSNPTPNPKWTISFVMRDTITNRWLTYSECKDRLLSLNSYK